MAHKATAHGRTRRLAVSYLAIAQSIKLLCACYHMCMSKIVLAISGSLRKDSLTTKLTKAFGKRAPEDVEFRIADISRLPIYNQDLELPEPDFLLEWKKQIQPADGILLVTPEYNRSIPPALKNALDWASRPQVPPGTGIWAGRPTAIAGVTPYALGAVGAVFHLRQVLTFLNMPAMQQPEFYLTFAGEKFDEHGELIDQNTMKHIDDFWMAFAKFIDTNSDKHSTTETDDLQSAVPLSDTRQDMPA